MPWSWYPSRCTTATRTGITFPLNQVVFDTDLQRFYVGDGSTAGGVVVGSGTGEANTASNSGTAGVGVWARKTGVDLEFKNLNAGSNKIAITDDVGNDEIDIDVNEGNLSIAGSQLTGTVTIDGSIPTGGTAGQVLEKIDGTSYNVQWATPSGGSGEANTASNLGAGIGVFEGKVGVDLQFRSLVSQNNRLTITEDVGNDEVDFTVVEGNIDHDALSNFVANEHIDWTATAENFSTTGTLTCGAITSTGNGLIARDDATTNTVLNTLRLRRTTSGTPGSGIGASLILQAENSAGANRSAAILSGVLTTVTDAAEVSRIDLDAYVAGTSETVFSVSGSGPDFQGNVSNMTEEATPTTGDWLVGETAAGGSVKINVGNLPTGGGGEANTASNVGGGVGVFEGKTGVDLEFRSLVSQTSIFTITEDVANDEIDFEITVGNAGEQLTVNEAGTALEYGLASKYVEARKASPGTITGGSPVYIAGFNVGGYIEIEEADASAGSTMPALGLAYEDIDNLANGRVLMMGNTVGLVDTSSWSVGDSVYVSETAGALTNVKPTGAALIQKIGTVARSHATSGQLTVVGAGRTNDVPNIASANFWLGNASGVATAVTMSGDATMDNAGAVTLADESVTLAKMAHMATDSLLGRDTAGTGDVEVLSPATVRTILNVADGANNYTHPNHTGDVTSTGDGATVIANNAVTLAKMADMATDSFLGRDTAGTGDPEVLSAATARTILNVADGAEPKPSLRASATIVDPVATDDMTLFFTPVAITVTDVRSHITGTTNVVFNIQHASTRTGTGLDVFTSDITLTSTAGQSNSTGFNDATIPANSYVWVEVVSVSGTPSRFHATVIYTED